MITKIKSHDVYISNHGWLTSRFLFSFSEYLDPSNIEWGALRVFNDDTIAPHSGFPMHSHREMEIVTIMLSGTLTHKDSMGNEKSITEGYVQRMTTGTGVTHSEYNNHNEPVHLYQLWFYPHTNNLAPNYEEKEFTYTKAKGLHTLVSPISVEGSLTANSPVTILFGNTNVNDTQTFLLKENEYAHLYLKEGELTVNDIRVLQGDQIRIHNETSISVTSIQESEFLYIVSS